MVISLGNSNKFELLLFTGIILFAKAKPSFSTKVLFNLDFVISKYSLSTITSSLAFCFP